MTTFSNNLRRLRKKAGITQEELAEIVNSSVPSVSGWENGAPKPRLQQHTDALCSYFGVTEEELLEGTPTQLQTNNAQYASVLAALSPLNKLGIEKVAAYAIDIAGNPIYRA